jgi:arylformamidase
MLEHPFPQTLYDISVPIHPQLVVWPGDPPITIDTPLHLAKGDPATVSHLSLGSHTGTHVDAFSHFKATGLSLDDMDLSMYLGPAWVIDVGDSLVITPEVLIPLNLAKVFEHQSVKRILFKTRNSTAPLNTPWFNEAFQESFVHLTPEASQYLVSLGIGLVGIDYLSVEGFHQVDAPSHHCLMDAGVYILEGLYLAEVPPGWYELICLPLKLKNGDGAPARAVLRTLPS